jgi:hypothetical protein
MPAYKGYVRIVADSARKEIWIERSGKANPDAYPGTEATQWSHENTGALVAFLDKKAKELKFTIGRKSKTGERTNNGIYEPEGRKGHEPVLMRYSVGVGVFIQFLPPLAEKPKAAKKESTKFVIE